MLDWKKGKLVKIENETANTKRFFIELQSHEDNRFKPGQFITLDLPIHESKNKRLRSYSIASSPDHDSNILELVIVKFEEGLGTTYLFNVDELKVGDEISYRGPLGHFTMPEEMPDDLFLICTGTGIAPFRSMIHWLYNNEQSNYKNVYLVYGTRTKNDMLYHNEMTELATKMKGFHYLPILSREALQDKKGYVHDVYLPLCEGKPDAQFMLCGWKNMVDDARKTLQELGYDKKQIHFELYG